MLNNVLISVNMPVYNGGKYIGQAIQSIINQTYKNWELIIVNDGSTDNTIDVVNSFTDSRIKLFQNECNKGLTYTRNKAVELSQGKYIAILDSDDVSYPDRLEKQLIFLEQNENFGLLGTSIEFIDADGNNIAEPNINHLDADIIPVYLLFSNFFCQSSIMIRKEILPNPVYREEYPPTEDYDLWIRLSRLTKVCSLAEILVKYRIHGNNITIKDNNLLKAGENKNYVNQLNSLGINTNDNFINVHSKFINFDKDFSFTELSDLSELLHSVDKSKLSSLNIVLDKYNLFVNNNFKKRIHQYFLPKTYDLKLLRQFFNFKIKAYNYYSFMQILKFIFKCLINYNR